MWTALAKIASAIAKIGEYLTKLELYLAEAKFVAKKGKRTIATVLVIAVLLVSSYPAMMTAAAHSISTSMVGFLRKVLNISEEEVLESMKDAESFSEMLDKLNFFHVELDIDGELQLIDQIALKKVVDEVAEYNKSMREAYKIKYEYRIENADSLGDLPYMSSYSGEFIVADVQSSTINNIKSGLIIKDDSKESKDSITIGGLNINIKPPETPVPGSPQISGSQIPVESDSGSGTIGGWKDNSTASNSTPNGFVPGSGFVSSTPTPKPTATSKPATTSKPSVTSKPSEKVPATPAPTPTPKPKHKTKYDDVKYTIDLRSIESNWDNGPDGRYESMEYLEWQPVVAFVCMYIVMNSQDWGTFGKGESYYISDEKIEELVEVFTFDYYMVQEITKGTGLLGEIKWNEFVSGDSTSMPFLLSSNTVVLENGTASRTTHRIPRMAPAKIANSYIDYSYEYERKDETTRDGNTISYVYLKNVTYTVQPSRLLEVFEEKVENFDAFMYVYALKMLPHSEKSVAYFEDVIMAPDNDEVKTWSTSSSAESPSINVVAGVTQYSNYTNGYFDMNGEFGGLDFGGDGLSVPLYSADGYMGNTRLSLKPHSSIAVPGTTYGEYKVKESAYLPLDVSDNLTLKEIEYLLNDSNFLTASMAANSPVLNTPEKRAELAKCLLSYQNETGSSICGLLGIMKQEGGFTSTIAKKGWNFFNITVGSTGYPSLSEYTRFRDYKTAVETGMVSNSNYKYPEIVAFNDQVRWIYNNYWNRSKGKQNTYYSMCFNGYMLNGAVDLEAYATISHSYCPPWDDRAMPYSSDSYTIIGDAYYRLWKDADSGVYHGGWINNCATYRERYYKVAKGSE